MRRIVEFEVEFPFITNEKVSLSLGMRLGWIVFFSCIDKILFLMVNWRNENEVWEWNISLDINVNKRTSR